MRLIEKAREFGISTQISSIDFSRVMARMRSLIDADIDSIRRGLTESENIDYFHDVAEFVAPYTLKVGEQTMRSKMIFLCTGSQAVIPPVKGLKEAGYMTSDEVLHLKKLPASVAVIGGGYIAAELGHFLAAMGSKVTIIGRNPSYSPKRPPRGRKSSGAS